MCEHVAAAAKSLQSCPTLCDPIDGSPPDSPIPGILQARNVYIVLPLDHELEGRDYNLNIFFFSHVY